MDEQKFREWVDVIQGVLKVFVAAKKDDGQSFLNELIMLDSDKWNQIKFQKIQERFHDRKWIQPVNVIREQVINKIITDWTISLSDVDNFKRIEWLKYDKNVFRARTNFNLLHAIYYYYDDNKQKVKNALSNITSSLLTDLWLEWSVKHGEEAFDYNNRFWVDDFYIWFFNVSHPTRETAKQVRIQSLWNDKLIVWLYANKNFISGKFEEFDISSVSYNDILNLLLAYKNDVLSDVFTWDNIPNLIDYLKENVSKYISRSDEAEVQRKEFLSRYPLEKLKDLTLENYCYQQKWEWNGESFTNLLKANWSSSVAVWELVQNWQNRLFYKKADWSYAVARVMDDYKSRAEWDLTKTFNLFLEDTYNFINNFNVDNYNPSNYIQWATYLKSAIFFFYKWDIIVNLWTIDVAKSIAENLWISDDTDAIWYDILISKYLERKAPELVNEFWYYAIWRCLNDYYKTYLKKLRSKNSTIYYYAVWTDLWDWDRQQEFYNRWKLIIWWYELGDLKKFKSDSELIEKFRELKYHDTETHFIQTFSKFKQIKKWDIVCAKSVYLQKKEMYIYAVWVVQQWYDEWYEYIDWLWHSLPVVWKILNEKYQVDWAKYQKTLTQIQDDNMKRLLKQLLWNDLNNSLSLTSSTMKDIPLNTILYWVPWTWKTYNTINYAVAIIENKPLKDILEESHNNRDAVRKRYENYVDSWQIVFTTFHQSFWYEDFIEGIKAEVEEWWISYKIKDWIFKELCLKISKWEWKNSDNFEESRNKLVDELNEKDTINIPFLSWKWSFKVELNEYWTWLASRTYDENWEWIRWHSKFFNYDQLYNIYKWLPWVPAWWHDNYRKAVVNEMKKRFWLNEYQENLFSDSKKNYVLIIDEINRWNISKIFWELITLLEPDKRLWWKEELKVKLPYSQDEFWVPNNLFVLWTMNTADRSIALIDLALRRRFKFREIEPNSDLLDNINVTWIDIKKMFETINDRIELLYDRDHLLWHAYFLPLKDDNSLEKLNSIMLDNIIPLLQEYFHDDWEKIQMILWDHDNQSFKDDSNKIIQKRKNFNNEKVLWFTDEDFEWDSFMINKELNINSYLWIYNK